MRNARTCSDQRHARNFRRPIRHVVRSGPLQDGITSAREQPDLQPPQKQRRAKVAGPGVIDGVTQTLTTLIGRLPHPSSPGGMSVTAVPPSPNNAADATVYLYDVLEDPMTRNRVPFRE